jgi:hypothetical protein
MVANTTTPPAAALTFASTMTEEGPTFSKPARSSRIESSFTGTKSATVPDSVSWRVAFATKEAAAVVSAAVAVAVAVVPAAAAAVVAAVTTGGKALL